MIKIETPALPHSNFWFSDTEIGGNMRLYIFIFLGFFLSLPAQASILFTGSVDDDFESYSCLTDDQDATSNGLDLRKVCFFYDGYLDELYVGVAAHSFIFGDVDGDGNPDSGTSDTAELGTNETLVISLDLNGDSRDSAFDVNTVDVLIGVSPTTDYNSLGVFNVINSYLAVIPYTGFGGTELVNTVISGSPSVNNPDLEFTIQNFSTITANDGSAIVNTVELMVFTDAFGGPGEDFLPSFNESISFNIFDSDADGLYDYLEVEQGSDPTSDDSDGDGITDGTEIYGDNPTDPNNEDTDGDGCTDGFEDSNFDGSWDVDLGETDPNDPDSDDDGLDDCTELTGTNPTDPNNSDTDGDLLIDGDEDTNGNGRHEAGLDETDPNKRDTDSGGVNDGDERTYGYDPNDPSDDQTALNQIASLRGQNQVQGSGFCSLVQNSQGTFSWGVIGLALLSLLGLRRKIKA